MESALSDLGLQVQRSNDDEVICACPEHLRRTGHEDRHPSFSVNRDSGLFSCFSCHYRGNFLTLVNDLLYEGNDIFAAARWVRLQGINIERARERLQQTQDHAPRRVLPVEVDNASLALFVDPPPAVLAQRGISTEACEHFGLRWDADRGHWIIPIRTRDGKLLGWQRKGEGKKRYYVRNYPRDMSKSQTLFGIAEFPLGAVAVLMESPLDVAHLWTLGYEGGLASYGSAVSTAQMHLVMSVSDELIMALDNDEAGWDASEAIRVGVRRRGVLVSQPWANRFTGGMRFLRYEQGTKDIGDMDEAEIERSLTNAQHWTVARFPTSRPAGLPGGGRAANARPWAKPRLRATGRR